jgi:hypothetical protein
MGKIKPEDVVELMPLTTKWVKGRRKAYGHQHVNDQIRRAMRGERNRFYACEAGHQFGTPFDLSEQGHFLLSMPFARSASFLAFIREPGDVADVAVGVPGLLAAEMTVPEDAQEASDAH